MADGSSGVNEALLPKPKLFPSNSWKLYIVGSIPILLLILTRPRQVAVYSEFPSEVVSLTKVLVDIPSPSGQEQDVFEYARLWFLSQSEKLEVTTQSVKPLREGLQSRNNLFVMHEGASRSDIRVLLSTHLDTVPGRVDLENMPKTDAKLYGRGSVDAKGQAAGMMLAFMSVPDKQVGLLFLCGEEVDHGGMRVAGELGLPRLSLINGEPTESKIATKQKGALSGKLVVTGQAAHSGYPHLGDSAIHRLVEVTHKLLAEKWIPGVTMNIGQIRGGLAKNVVADWAEADILWRITGHSKLTETQAQEVISLVPNVKMQVTGRSEEVEYYVPLKTANRTRTTAVSYNTDVPFYKGDLRRAVLFGGGSILDAHRLDEFIELDQLRKLPELLQEITRELVEDSDED